MTEQDGVEVERHTLFECQYCDSIHDTAKEHQEHVERMHYAEMLRNSELVGADIE